jgi:hypothetical protein
LLPNVILKFSHDNIAQRNAACNGTALWTWCAISCGANAIYVGELYLSASNWAARRLGAAFRQAVTSARRTAAIPDDRISFLMTAPANLGPPE